MEFQTTKQMLINITDEESLKSNLSFAAFYIALFENFADTVVDKIRGFLSDGIHFNENGEITYIESERYKSEIVNRKDNESNKLGVLKSSMLWFVDNAAITMSEYEQFIEIRDQRNRFVHELTSFLLNGFNEPEIKMFFELLRIYKKIDKWWINEIEIPTSADDIPQDYDPNSVGSVISGMFDIMVDVIFRGKSEEHKELLRKYFD
ncbi:MAG: hypothetical protein VB091_11345 [Christensenella sp.]|nr:hypothetical protein [Christensenella sp.]